MGFRAKSGPAKARSLPESRAPEKTSEPGAVVSSGADRLLSQILDSTFEAIISVTPDQRIKVFNKGAERIFGYSAREVIGQSLDCLIPSSFRAVHGGYIDSFSQTAEPGRLMDRRGEIRGLKKDGTEFPAEASISKMQIDDEFLFTVVLRDVTERKESEEALAKSQALFQNLIEGFQYGISIHQDRKLVFVNREAVRMHGYSVDEAASEKINDFIMSEDIPKVSMAIDDLLDGKALEKPLEYRGVRKDGSIFPIEVRSQTIEWGGMTAVLNVLTDVTDRKRAEESETRLGRIIERSLNEVYTFDSKTLRFIEVNHGARANLGYDIEELHTLTPVDIKPKFALASFEEAISPLRDGMQDELVFETVHERKDGSTYDVEVHLQLMTEETPSVFVAMVKDITQRKQVERDLQLALVRSDQASRSKSDFLANISHELRTPLNAVIGLSEIMRAETFGPVGVSQYRDYVDKIHESGTHLLSLVTDILDLSKIEAGKMEISAEVVDVEREFAECQAILEERIKEADVTLVNTMRSDLPALCADKRAIKQIFFNLLSNAVKFTPAGGEVSATAEISADGCFVVTISDTGIGIQPDDIETALTPFSQVDSSLSRSHGGTGLGLPLVKSLIELHGGSFHLDSEPGVGTCATIRFPAERVLDSHARAGAGL